MEFSFVGLIGRDRCNAFGTVKLMRLAIANAKLFVGTRERKQRFLVSCPRSNLGTAAPGYPVRAYTIATLFMDLPARTTSGRAGWGTASLGFSMGSSSI